MIAPYSTPPLPHASSLHSQTQADTTVCMINTPNDHHDKDNHERMNVLHASLGIDNDYPTSVLNLNLEANDQKSL